MTEPPPCPSTRPRVCAECEGAGYVDHAGKFDACAVCARWAEAEYQDWLRVQARPQSTLFPLSTARQSARRAA